MRACSALRLRFALLGLPVLGSGCVSEFAADTTANFLAKAAPAARAYFDYESAGYAAADGLVQLEGLHRVSPDNERLTLTLAQAYVVYAFGWVMDKQEQAALEGRYDEADREQARAFLMYERAQRLVLHIMRQRDAGIDHALESDPDVLTAYLREHYADPEDDIELVFWLAVAWGSDDHQRAFDRRADRSAAGQSAGTPLGEPRRELRKRRRAGAARRLRGGAIPSSSAATGRRAGSTSNARSR